MGHLLTIDDRRPSDSPKRIQCFEPTMQRINYLHNDFDQEKQTQMEQACQNIMKNQYNLWNNSSWNPQKARERFAKDQLLLEHQKRSKKLYRQVFDPTYQTSQTSTSSANGEVFGNKNNSLKSMRRNQATNIYGTTTISTRQETDRNQTTLENSNSGMLHHQQ